MLSLKKIWFYSNTGVMKIKSSFVFEILTLKTKAFSNKYIFYSKKN